MPALFDDEAGMRKARGRFTAEVARLDPLPADYPVKFLVDALFTALNTGNSRDIQRSKIWIVDHIIPSSERLRLFTAFLLALSRAFAKGFLPTCANRIERTRASRIAENDPRVPMKTATPSARFKRLHMLYILSDVFATISPTELEIPKKKLPAFDRTSTMYELKYYFALLAQLAVCDSEDHAATTAKPATAKIIQDALIGNLVRRGVLSSQEGSELSTKVASHDGKALATVVAELGLDQKIELPDAVLADAEIVLDRILPSHHVLPDHPSSSWDVLPAMNGLFLKRIRGFPLRAGGLQNGLMLPNAGKQSSAATKADILATCATAARLTSRFTSAADIADVDQLGNIIYADTVSAQDDQTTAHKPHPRALNYAALVRDDISKIQDLESRFQQRALGYDGVAKLHTRDGHAGAFHSGGGLESDRGNGSAARRIDQDVERAMALARGDPDRNFGGRGGGPMRGGFRGDFKGGGGGYRGGGGAYGRGGGGPAGNGFGRGDFRYGDRQY